MKILCNCQKNVYLKKLLGKKGLGIGGKKGRQILSGL